MSTIIVFLTISGCFTTVNNYYDTGCCCEEDTGDTSDSAAPASCEDSDLPALPAVEPASCPTVPAMDPIVEWRWPHDDFQGDYTEVLVTPVIGDVSGDGVPDVAFTAFDTYEWDPGALVILSGDDGSLLLYEDTFIDGSELRYPPGLGGVALGDVDGDLVPELCMPGVSVSVFCVHADGTVVMSGGTATQTDGLHAAAYPIIADLDGSGGAEVIIGGEIVDGSGTVLVTAGSDGAIPDGVAGASVAVVSDLWADGSRDAVFGNIAADIDGNTTWSVSASDGLAAVGDLDGNGTPEVVRTAWGWLTITSVDGTAIIDAPLAGEVSGGLGGPPTIADLDGDGVQDVVVASISVLTAYSGALLLTGPTDLADAVIWQLNPTEQLNGILSTAAFDIDADGDHDIIFADEEDLFILDGTTGANLLAGATTDFSGGAHSSESALEYPTIADIDGDGSAEIVLASSQHTDNYDATQWSGVRAIGSATDAWPDAPSSWPMHGYTPALTGPDLLSTDPTTTAPEWLTSGTFRAQPATWTSTDAPDLVVLEPEFCDEECPEQVWVWVPVGNAGGTDSVATSLTVSTTDGTWSSTMAVGALASGEVVWTGPFLIPASVSWSAGLSAAVDPDALIEECSESNNTVEFATDPCEG